MKKFKRRNSTFFEKLLLNSLMNYFLGFFVVIFLPGFIRWDDSILRWFSIGLNETTLLANFIAYTVSFVVLLRLKKYPGAHSSSFIMPVIGLSWLFVFSALLFFRADYSRHVLITSYLFANFWGYIVYFTGTRLRTIKLAVLPHGRILDISNIDSVKVKILDFPDLENKRYDAVVADLHCDDLSAEWESFLASCTLQHIPVYHFKQVEESLTGRVRIEHLSENELGSLLPSSYYVAFKQFVDTCVALLLLPVLIPVMIVTGLLIKLDSSGPIFFIQKRIGYRGKVFNVYKFRSMCTETSGKGFTEGEDDPRITKVGRIIRKFRIDELPQLLNVIKGEMSFIGPRPESLELSQWYERDVPFFAYRHIVRPGISGWAQVNQGYAAEVEGMIEKLQYDFYYIKHCSLWLDILIVFKTIRTIVTGFGAR